MSASKRFTQVTAATVLSILAAAPAVPGAWAASSESSSVPSWSLRVAPARFAESAIHAIHVGMTQDDVASLAGAPNARTRPHRGSVSWDYDYVDTWGYTSVFSVVFNGDGVVVDKASARRPY